MAADLRQLLRAAIQPPATNPLSDENLPGATSVTVKFDPDGTYKQNVVGRFAPVKQLAQSLSQAPRKPQNFGALGPEQILKATQMFNQTGANRQGALDSVARLASQLQGADTAARAQLLAEHKANNPDLVMTREGVALPRSEMPKYLLGLMNQRLAEDDSRRDLIMKMLGHEEVAIPNSRAYRGAQGAAASKDMALRGKYLTETEGQRLENQSFYPVTRGDNKAMMSTRWEKTGRGGAGSKDSGFQDLLDDYYAVATVKDPQTKTLKARGFIPSKEIEEFNKKWSPTGVKLETIKTPLFGRGWSKDKPGMELAYLVNPAWSEERQAQELLDQLNAEGFKEEEIEQILNSMVE